MWAVLVAAIAMTAIGALWFSPLLCGKVWMRLSGMTPESCAEVSKSAMISSYAAQFIAAIVTSFIFSKLVAWATDGTTAGALKLAVLVWLGFIAATTLGEVLWSKKPWTMYFINAGYYLVALIVSALIIAVWK